MKKVDELIEELADHIKKSFYLAKKERMKLLKKQRPSQNWFLQEPKCFSYSAVFPESFSYRVL